MVECGWTEKKIALQITPPFGIFPPEPVSYANVRYGRSGVKGVETVKTNLTGKAEFCYTRGFTPYVSIQKTDYVFSDRPIRKISELGDVSWGSSSEWFKVTGLYKTIFSLKKPVVEVEEVIEKVCKVWKTMADPNVPSKLVTYFTPYLPISISAAEWVCQDLDITERINDVKAKVIIAGSTIAEIPIINGYGSRVDIGRLPAFTSILKSLTSRGISSIPIEISILNKKEGSTIFPFSVEIPTPEVPTPEVPTPEVPIPEIRQVCTVGEEQTVRCADGTIIVTHVCEKDPITGINFWNPTGRPCPVPELGKVAKIMVPPDGELRAFEGMDVTITASVMCGASPSHGEPAILIIDGEQVASKNTSQGFVSFKWTATTEPARTHRVVVSVPKSDQCPMHGEARDSKPITVSRIIPGTLEQLRMEREAYQSQLAALREERKRIREMSLAARAAVTPITIPVTPPVELPITPPTTPPVEPPITPPVEPPVGPPVEPQPGIIDIPSIITPPTEYPIEIFINGVLKGSPPLEVEVDPGTYHITVKLTNFTPLDRKVTITEGQTLTITNMEFLL